MHVCVCMCIMIYYNLLSFLLYKNALFIFLFVNINN